MESHPDAQGRPREGTNLAVGPSAVQSSERTTRSCVYGTFGTGEGLGSGTEVLGKGPDAEGGEIGNSTWLKELAGIRKSGDVGELAGPGKSESGGELGAVAGAGSLSTIFFASSIDSLSGET